jgi:hypothetical protein
MKNKVAPHSGQAPPRKRALNAADLVVKPPELGSPALVQTHELAPVGVTIGADKRAEDSTIRVAMREVYDDAAKNDTKAPNVKELLPRVRSRLEAKGYEASASRIQTIGDEHEFKNRRQKVGRRWPRTRRK